MIGPFEAPRREHRSSNSASLLNNETGIPSAKRRFIFRSFGALISFVLIILVTTQLGEAQVDPFAIAPMSSYAYGQGEVPTSYIPFIYPDPYDGGVLVAECTFVQYCYLPYVDENGTVIPGAGGPTAWSYTLTASDLASLGNSASLVLVANNPGVPGPPYWNSVGTTTMTVTAADGTTTQTVAGTAFFAPSDPFWLGTFSLPTCPISVTISGTIGEPIPRSPPFPPFPPIPATDTVALYLQPGGTSPPYISTLEPSIWVTGQTTNITITGGGFTSDSDVASGCPATSVAVTVPSGIPIVLSNVHALSETEITASVTPPAIEPIELATVSVGTQPNAATAEALVTGCSVPTVTSISPNIWLAGHTYNNVVITGSGFTTPELAAASLLCPTNTVTVRSWSGITIPVGAVTVNSSTQITVASLSPPASETTEGATVVVSGGLQPNPNADVLQTPTITWTSDPDGTTPTISGPNAILPNPSTVVGQPITLTTSTPNQYLLPYLPVPLTGLQTVWTVGPSNSTSPTNIGGYTVINPNPVPTEEAQRTQPSSATVNPTILTNPNLITYWIVSGSPMPITYQYCATGQGGNQCSDLATATFDVAGPIGATLEVTWGPMMPMIFNSAIPPGFGLGNGSVVGIGFTASDEVGSPSGQFTFVQIIDYDKAKRMNSITSPCDETTGTGLDTEYPYRSASTTANSSSTNDNPFTGFQIVDEEIVKSTNFTMYSLWTPTANTSGPPPVPVPIGSINWQWYADAVQTSSTPPYSWAMNTNTMVENPTSSAGAFSQGSTYPTWTSYGFTGVHTCVEEGGQ